MQVALAALTHTLLRRTFVDDYVADRPAMQISATVAMRTMLDVADDLKGSRAFTAVEAAKALGASACLRSATSGSSG